MWFIRPRWPLQTEGHEADSLSDIGFCHRLLPVALQTYLRHARLYINYTRHVIDRPQDGNLSWWNPNKSDVVFTAVCEEEQGEEGL